MVEHKCNSCFYKEFDKDKEFPCAGCDNYGSWVPRNMYTPQADTKEIMAFNGTSSDDVVNQPKHYTAGKFEVIDVIEDWDLNFRLANAIKYIARHKHKGKALEDLKKARWYLQREIDKYELNT